MGKAHTQTSDNDRLKKCKTNFKLNNQPSYCVAYVSGLWLFIDKLLGGFIKPKYKYYEKNND
jgi:hypothetical protein